MVDLIIPGRDLGDLTLACIESFVLKAFVDKDGKSVKGLVTPIYVDTGSSTDIPRQVAKLCEDLGVKFKVVEKPGAHFPSAINAGIAAGANNFQFLANNDTLAARNCIAICHRHFMNCNMCAVVGARTDAKDSKASLIHDKRVVAVFGSVEALLAAEPDAIASCLHKRIPRKTQAVMVGFGAALTSRKALERVRIADKLPPNTWMHPMFEDVHGLATDDYFCMRAKQLGLLTWYAEGAVCKHIGGASFREHNLNRALMKITAKNRMAKLFNHPGFKITAEDLRNAGLPAGTPTDHL